MALADIIDSVAALLTGVAVKLGGEHLPARDAPPRVVFVPDADSFSGASRSSVTGRAVRSLVTRVAGVRVHIWAAGAVDDVSVAKDLRATEGLLHRVIWAIQQVAAGRVIRHGVDWPEVPVAGHLGRLCVLRLSFELPVTVAEADDTSTTALITTFGNPELTSTLDLPPPSADPTGSPAP